MREETIKIEKMAYGGAGVGRLDGKVFFIPFAAAGDTLRIRVTSEKKSYAEGEIAEVIEPAVCRTDPPCPVFGRCGGCDWQHLKYDEQLRAKEQIFSEILWRTARVDPALILPIIGSEKEYGYRSRAQIKLRYSGGELHAGFFRAGSHYVIDLPGQCAVSDETVNSIYKQLCAVLSDFPEPAKIPQVDITVGDDGEAVVILHYIGDRTEAAVEFVAREGKAMASAKGLFIQSGRKETIKKIYGCESTCYEIPQNLYPGISAMRLRTGRGGFSQVNLLQNLNLVSTVLSWLEPAGNETVLDLFCGNGNFSLPLACVTAFVTGVEDYGPAVRDAELNMRETGLRNASFECSDAAQGLLKMAASGKGTDIVILDPPRTGAAAAVRIIPELRPKKIIYVSCDPPTLARDLAALAKRGYGVVKSRPVDMFPQTYHLESVTLLEPFAR